MSKKNRSQTRQISNRRARHDYDLDDSLVVGIELTGAETKALRKGHGHIKGSYVNIKDGELWLLNATITGNAGIKIPEEEQTRTRKLLAKRREINELAEQKKQGKTILPLEVLTQGRYIKLRIAPGRGKRKYDKRQILKKKDEKRDINRALKYR